MDLLNKIDHQVQIEIVDVKKMVKLNLILKVISKAVTNGAICAAAETIGISMFGSSFVFQQEIEFN